MSDSAQHLSNEVILQFIDNELPARDVSRVEEHLAVCLGCRDRQLAMESTSSALLELYRSELPKAGSYGMNSRLRLRARLIRSRYTSFSKYSLSAMFPFRFAAIAALTIIFMALVFRGAQGWKFWHPVPSVETEVIVPNHSLTPGAVRPVTLAEVCSADDGDLDPEVSPSIDKAVLSEYGIHSGKHSRNYQIDYLVNPQLGGTSDIRNLWPESYSSNEWNAHAKDNLERRLQQMVCSRTVDLAVAQRAIATDWIAAYKKYMGGEHS